MELTRLCQLSAATVRPHYSVSGKHYQQVFIHIRTAHVLWPRQTEWQEGDTSDAGLFSADSATPTAATSIAASSKGDENDPLGLMRGGVLAYVIQAPSPTTRELTSEHDW